MKPKSYIKTFKYIGKSENSGFPFQFNYFKHLTIAAYSSLKNIFFIIIRSIGAAKRILRELCRD